MSPKQLDRTKKCVVCKSSDVVMICPTTTCKKSFCLVCAKIDDNEAELENWRCEECIAFNMSARKNRNINTPVTKLGEKFMTPRNLMFDTMLDSTVRKFPEKSPLDEDDDEEENSDENVNDRLTMNESQKLRNEVEFLKTQLNEMTDMIRQQQSNRAEHRTFDEMANFERPTTTKGLKPETQPFIPKQNDNPVPVVDLTRTSPAIDFAQQLAEAIKLLQPNVATAKVERTGFDPDEQLKLTMIRASLPELPKFSGVSDEWPLFERIYKTTSETGKYTDELNHLRLLKCLEGEAKIECQRLLSGMAGGTAIMNHLKSVYGDAEKILSRQVKKLLRMRAPRDLEKYQLKDFVSELESLVINAESLERADFLSQPSIIDQLVLKLRDRHQDAWGAMKLANPNVTLKDLWKYLAERLKDASAQPPTEGYSYRSKDTKRLHLHREEKECCAHCKSESHELHQCSEFKKLMLTDKKRTVRNKGLCNCCLRQGHRWKDCRTKRMCNLDGCKEFHHRLLHAKPSAGSQNRDSVNREIKGRRNERHQVNPDQQSRREDAETVNFHKSSSVLYKILPIVLHGNNGQIVKTFAFLDDGSSVTLLDQEIYEKLNLNGRKKLLKLKWTSGICRKEPESYTVDCRVSKGEKSHIFSLYNVKTVEKLELMTQTVVASELQQRYRHLRGVPLPSFENVQPKLLIGLKNASFLKNTVSLSGNDDEPIAVKTKLGWTVYGAIDDELDDVCSVHEIIEDERVMTITEDNSDEALHGLVKSYFAIESFGTTGQQLMSADDEKAMRIIQDTMRHDGERYEVGLLWKNEETELPDNRPMAMKRLINLEKSLERNPDLKQWTIEKFKELLLKGYVRKATDDDATTDWKRKWILPTFTVVNENKIPMKPRQVYDAAAKYKGVSLNSELLSGPDLLIPLNAGLYKFRENNVCVTADVTEMYNQIKLIEPDQQCQRLLWRDCEASRDPDLYVFTRLSFGPTCAPAMAQAVKNIHAEKYKEEYPEAVEGLIERTFMDDYFNSHATIEDALRISKDAVKIMKDAGFELCKFQSNSKEFLESMPRDSVRDELVCLEPDNAENVTKVLGMFWDTATDAFTYRLHEEHLKQELSTHDTMPTKRQVLRLVMKIFDPLGLISHFTIRGKMILQEIWKDGTPWDASINTRLLTAWKDWIRELKGIVKLQIPRQYAPMDPATGKIELHVFMDASEKAYAACAYMRIEIGNEIHVALAGAKAKVVPLKVISIPRCELLAALIGARLSKSIRDLHSLRIDKVTYWSDSKCVLLWINSDELRFKQFVGMRISEILELTSRAQWRYIPSKLNVADDATKCNETEIRGDRRWFQGPDFLKKPPEEWPGSNEVEAEEHVMVQMLIEKSDDDTNERHLSTIDDVSPKFKAKWRSLVRVIARMLKWLLNWKAHKVGKETEEFLSTKLLRMAELKIFQKIQRESFGNEYKTLMDGKRIEKECKLYQFCPFIKDEVIRMESRLQRAAISYAAKNPVILPNRHELVELLLQHIHEVKLHFGEESIIADARKKAWIINVRAAVKRVKKGCQKCKNRDAKPMVPKMGLLPTYRFDIGVKPFTHVGIDCFGPLEVAVKRSREKRYGMIFCCMVSRAVHIELLYDMSTEHCMMAIMSFLALRGPSKYFYSDNGKNFQGSNGVMNKELNEVKYKLGESVADKHRIEWFFNPPWAPHFGGPYERMIKSIKLAVDTMIKSLNPRTPNEPILRAAFNESIGIMNSRPLTHTPVNAEDEMPLTPNDLLGQSNLTSIPGLGDEESNHCKSLYRRAQHLTNVFVKKWVDSYLPVISRRCKWFENVKPIEVDDIVLIINPTMPRRLWKLGRIIKTYKGDDNQVRVVDVQTADKKVKRRAVHYLAVLDVKADSFTPVMTEPQQEKTVGSMSSTDCPTQQN